MTGAFTLAIGRVFVMHFEAGGTLLDFDPDNWDRVMAVHLRAPFLLSQEVGRRQLEARRPGSHVFVASLTSILGLPNLIAYNAAKSGLM